MREGRIPKDGAKSPVAAREQDAGRRDGLADAPRNDGGTAAQAVEAQSGAFSGDGMDALGIWDTDDALAAACRSAADARMNSLDAVARERMIREAVVEGLDQLERPEVRLKEALRTLTPSMLFAGVGDAVACAVVGAAAVFACIALALSSASTANVVPVAAFIGAPVLYGFLIALTMWRDARGSLAAWRRTCRVTVYEVGALRMLAFGVVSLAASVPTTGALWVLAAGAVPLTWLFAVACAGLCIFAALALASLLAADGRGPVAQAAACTATAVLWIALGAVLLHDAYGAALVIRVPAVVFVVITLAAVGCYLVELRAFVGRGCGGARSAAAGV